MMSRSLLCLAPRGASGLKFHPLSDHPDHNQVSPHAGRVDWNDRCLRDLRDLIQSRPTRGEWIEIATGRGNPYPSRRSRPAWGEWIEICERVFVSQAKLGLAPHGASILKIYNKRQQYKKSRNMFGSHQMFPLFFLGYHATIITDDIERSGHHA